MAAEELRLPTINPDTASLWQITGKEYYDHPRRVFQINDLDTVEHFLGIHHPRLVSITEVVSDFPPLSLMQVKHLMPNREWFLSARESPDTNLTHADSIHGVDHAARVGLYARLIAKREHLDERATNILLAAALIHDTRRIDDRVDPDHGVKAASDWEGTLGLLKGNGIQVHQNMVQTVMALCKYHEIPAEKIPWNTLTGEAIQLLRYFMAADALDRYRAPDEQWWPSERYFDYDPKIKELFQQLMPFAKYFTLATEHYRLKNRKTINKAIVAVGREVGIAEPSFIERLGDLSPNIRRTSGLL